MCVCEKERERENNIIIKKKCKKEKKIWHKNMLNVIIKPKKYYDNEHLKSVTSSFMWYAQSSDKDMRKGTNQANL